MDVLNSLMLKVGDVQQVATFRSPIMTNSVERKQYEWKHEAEMTFSSKASVAENRDTEHSKGLLFFPKRFISESPFVWVQLSTIFTNGKSNDKVFIPFHLPTISKTADLVSGSSLYKEAIFKSISAALWGSDGFTWLKQVGFF